ncbi:unnamed protein product [Symbiodinium microadriaticum]|nr:unnamed protein product [Symbiodinium microadriaticum]
MSLKTDGHFSGIRPNCVGDPFKGTGYGGKKIPAEDDAPPAFKVPHGGPKEVFKRLYEGEKYSEISRVATAARMEGRAKFLTPNGFRYSSGPKFAYQGGYEGTFAKPKYMPHSKPDSNAKPKRLGPEDFEQRKIYTAPLKHCSGPPPVGVFRYASNYTPTPKTMFTEYHYVPCEYDSLIAKEKEEKKISRAKELGPAFKVSKEIQRDRPSSAPPVRLDPPNRDRANTASQKSLKSTGPGAMMRPRPESAASNRSRGGGGTGRRGSKSSGASGDDREPFRPSGGKVIYKYPEYLSDPYDDRKIREAQKCRRSTPPPVPPKKRGAAGQSDPTEEMQAWHPAGPTKSKLTKSVMFNPLALRSQNQCGGGAAAP